MRGVLILLGACSFQGHAKIDAGDTTDAAASAAADAPVPSDAVDVPLAIDAPDAPAAQAINLIAQSNGGMLTMHTGAFCEPASNDAAVCQPGEWIATNLNDGVLATGAQHVAGPNAWCSAARTVSAPPELFEYSIVASNASIERVAIQNFSEASIGGNYWTTHVRVSVAPENLDTFTVVLDAPLAATETLQQFVLGANVIGSQIRVELTSGVDPAYFELGEIEVWGRPL